MHPSKQHTQPSTLPIPGSAEANTDERKSSSCCSVAESADPLPATASSLPLIGLAGLGLLGMGLLIRRVRTN
jgi:hypothetical protein